MLAAHSSSGFPTACMRTGPGLQQADRLNGSECLQAPPSKTICLCTFWSCSHVATFFKRTAIAKYRIDPCMLAVAADAWHLVPLPIMLEAALLCCSSIEELKSNHPWNLHVCTLNTSVLKIDGPLDVQPDATLINMLHEVHRHRLVAEPSELHLESTISLLSVVGLVSPPCASSRCFASASL